MRIALFQAVEQPLRAAAFVAGRSVIKGQSDVFVAFRNFGGLLLFFLFFCSSTFFCCSAACSALPASAEVDCALPPVSLPELWLLDVPQPVSIAAHNMAAMPERINRFFHFVIFYASFSFVHKNIYTSSYSIV